VLLKEDITALFAVTQLLVLPRASTLVWPGTQPLKVDSTPFPAVTQPLPDKGWQPGPRAWLLKEDITALFAVTQLLALPRASTLVWPGNQPLKEDITAFPTVRSVWLLAKAGEAPRLETQQLLPFLVRRPWLIRHIVMHLITMCKERHGLTEQYAIGIDNQRA
jgi:hypothetical protein